MTTPKPKHGLYSRNFTSEEIAKLDALSTEQYVDHITLTLLISALERLEDPGLSLWQRLRLLKLAVRLIPK